MDQTSPTPSKGPFVVELKPGERVTGFYVARQKQLEPFRDRARGEFLTVILSDRTGQVVGRVWEDAAATAEMFAEGEVVKVQGDVETYQGRTQLIVQRLRKASPDEYQLADFQPASQRDVGEMLGQVAAAIELIQSPDLAGLVRRFFDDPEFANAFSQAPASRRVHHAYLGGLLEHTVESLAVCEAVLAIYPEIDGGLLRAGVLLRDVGKTLEYTWTMDLDYSDEGRLVGHVVLGDERVSRAIGETPDFPAELGLR